HFGPPPNRLTRRPPPGSALSRLSRSIPVGCVVDRRLARALILPSPRQPREEVATRQTGKRKAKQKGTSRRSAAQRQRSINGKERNHAAPTPHRDRARTGRPPGRPPWAGR